MGQLPNVAPVRMVKRGEPITPIQPQGAFQLAFGLPDSTAGRRIVVYGEGGVGKTSLCAEMPGKTVFFDLDKSLMKLPKISNRVLNGELLAVQGVKTFEDLRAALDSQGWDGVQNIVIDTMSVVETMATDFVLRTIKNDRGAQVKSIEDFGYGKGYRYVLDAFTPFLFSLEDHTNAGRNVILVCHSLIQQNTDPSDENFPRYEPKLLHSGSGKVSLRLAVRDWADDVLYVARNRAVVNGKAVTDDLRTIYTTDKGWCMAKSRKLQEDILLTDARAFWDMLLK